MTVKCTTWAHRRRLH